MTSLSTGLLRALRLYNLFVNPISFIARNSIGIVGNKFFLEQFNERCLDLGAGISPYKSDIIEKMNVAQYVALDISPSDSTQIIADVTSLPFASSSFDLAVSFDVIQHVEFFNVMLEEVSRTVKPGGHFLLTFPFLYPECDFHDFHRWTMEGMEKSLSDNDFEIIYSKRRGGSCFVFACFLNWLIQHAFPGQRRSWRAHRTAMSIARAILIFFFTIPTIFIAWIALFLDRMLPGKGIYMGGVVLARKNLSSNDFANVSGLS